MAEIGKLEKSFLNFHNDKLQIDLIEVYVEDHHEDEDSVSKNLRSIVNKIYAIDALLESIRDDFFEVSETHIDDNGRELSDMLRQKFIKLQENYYFDVIEQPEGDWTSNSVMFCISLMYSGLKQQLLLPAFRAHYYSVVENENLTKEEKETELEYYLQCFRKQFRLSNEFK